MLINQIKIYMFSLVLIVVTGCTTMGPPYTSPPPAPEGQSLIYLMRSTVGYGNFWETIFSINDVEVTSLLDKGYTWLHLKPGIYKISAGSVLNKNYLSFPMPVRAGLEYYIDYNQEYAGYNSYRNSIRAIKPEIGKVKIKDYAFQPAEHTHIPAK